MQLPSVQDLEDAVGALETYVAATIQRLTDDLRRYGPPEMPQLPEIPHIPLFASIPPPPPPPPPIPAVIAPSWVEKNRSFLIGAACVAGVGLVATGGWMYWSRKNLTVGIAKTKTGKEVVVVLGADSPLGQLVIGELRASDYIVIASVSTPEAISDVERAGKGFVKALVLDPTDPSSTIPFLRSLQSTLSLKFPIAPGDPYAPCPPSELPTLVSLVSLLSLSAPAPVPLEDSQASISSSTSTILPSLSTLSISKDYLPHLIATHLTPLSIIQSVLPLFRAAKKKGTRPSIVVALRGGAESTGLVGHQAATAMSNAAMAKGCEILRREVSLTPEISGLRVVMIDVGELALKSRSSRSPRRPTDPARFTDALLRTIGGPQRNVQLGAFSSWLSWSVLSTRDWWRGDRFSIGAGAGTYSLANHLPLWILDTLIIVPQRLLAYRDWLKHKTRTLRHEVAKERRRRKEREREARLQAELEADEGKAMVVVPKAPRPKTPSAASTHSTEDGPADSASEPDSDSGVDSNPPSETGDHHIGESWVMDVDSHHEAEATATA